MDTAKSTIWHSVYYGVGDFEIYTTANLENINLLAEGNYVTRPNDIEVGIIESINIINDEQDGRMLVVTGKFVKSLLNRRHIYNLTGNTNKSTLLSGNVEKAIRNVVANNIINCPFDSNRNISILKLGELAGINKTFIDEYGNPATKQTTYSNLLDYTDEVLKEYGLGSTIIFDKESKMFKYSIYEGIDRTVNNAFNNNPIIFSKEFDNLLSTEYLIDTSEEKNTVLIGGEGEGLERFYSIVEPERKGLDRRETFVDASSISKTYEDESGEEITYTDEQYDKILKECGKQEVVDLKVIQTFNGTIDITNGNYVYNRDFFLGDIVTVHDDDLGKYINVRIIDILESEDINGYTIDVKYANY